MSLRPMPRGRLPILLLLLGQLAFGLFPASAADTPEITVRVEKKGDTFIVDAEGSLSVAPNTAWDVLTDFDHMTGIMNNLDESRIVSRDGNTLTVRQHGTARYGLFSYEFDSLREIVLEPRRRIVSRQISGRARQFTSIARISPKGSGTELRYHAEIIPDGVFGRLFGAPFIRDEIDEQLTLMASEMLRRENAER